MHRNHKQKYMKKDINVREYCSHCNNEVELVNEFKVQICPECGKFIVPCSICPFQPGKCSNNCPLEALCNQLNEKNGKEMTLDAFVNEVKNLPNDKMYQGFEIIFPQTKTTQREVLIFNLVKEDSCYAYYLTNQTFHGKAYTFDVSFDSGDLFDALWNIIGEELQTINVKRRFN